ncbi:MAG: hypothetical protein M4579_003592 [Chaenotheca gracillima]|nr:MAG: hypothetical protein M4579_003592 [Chaenotheca gracillima]
MINNPTERKNQQVLDALSHDNHKQALQLCAQRIRRGEKGDHLLALKAYVLTCSSHRHQKDEGYVETKKLIDKEPQVVDIQTLKLLQSALIASHQSETDVSVPAQIKDDVSKLWERAIKAQPADEQLVKEWLFFSLEQGDWKQAQKAAMNLQRSFSKKRLHYFWAIWCSYMVRRSPIATDNDRALFGNLAYKMISRAAEDVPEGTESLMSPGRSIQTPQELHLLLLVYLDKEKETEALKILSSANIGIGSPIAKGDWDFVRIKLDILQTLEKWDETWNFCKTLLEASSASPAKEPKEDEPRPKTVPGDDWNVWMSLISASRKSDNVERLPATEELIRSYSKNQSSRNARLALLEFLAPPIGEIGGPNDSKLFEECKLYLRDNVHKSWCFDDLKTFIERLTPQKLWTDYTLANCSKLEYLHCRSRLNGLAAKEKLEQFVAACLRLYRDSLAAESSAAATDSHPSDEIGILVVVALVQLAQIAATNNEVDSTWSDRPIFRAAAVLERVTDHSPHNHQAVILLLRIYMMLGAGSLALEIHPRLAIKQIQNDTLGYNMYSRISTMHPHALKEAGAASELTATEREPYLALSKMLKIYQKASYQIPDSAKVALEQGNYSQIATFFEFGKHLQISSSRYAYRLEMRRMSRLFPRKSSAQETPVLDSLVHLPSELCDNRDYSILPKFEPSTVVSFEAETRCPTMPSRIWLEAFTAIEALYLLLTSSSETMPEEYQDCEAIAGHLQKLGMNPSIHLEMTGSEVEYLQLQWFIASTMTFLQDSSMATHPSGALQELQKVKACLQSRLEKLESSDVMVGAAALSVNKHPVIPIWICLHQAFYLLDELKFVIALLRFITKKISKSTSSAQQKDEVRKIATEIDKLVEQIYKRLRSQAEATKSRLSESGVVGAFVDAVFDRDLVNIKEDSETGGDQGPLGKALEELLGEPRVEMCASRILESGQEALDGILRVKLD